MNRRRRADDLEFLVLRRVLDDDVEHEAIELRFGQRVGAFELDRVLRREHVERLLELIGAALDGDAVLLHRLEQRRLRLRRRAVDFVREQDVAKIGPGANTICRRPVAASSLMMSVPVMSDGIRSGVNWMRLNLSSSTRASVWIRSVFARPGHADDQAVAADEQRQQHLPTTSSWPTMIFLSSVTIRFRPSFILSASATSSAASSTAASLTDSTRPPQPKYDTEY